MIVNISTYFFKPFLPYSFLSNTNLSTRTVDGWLLVMAIAFYDLTNHYLQFLIRGRIQLRTTSLKNLIMFLQQRSLL
jgi:hypothetical protein